MESLPVELVTHITTYMDLPSISSLRLTSRTLASKLWHENLPHFFAYKNVKLDQASLQDLVYMTSRGRAGCLLRHCTITNIADTDSLVLTRLLTNAFINLKHNSPRGGLVSLCLTVDSLPELHDEIDEQSDSDDSIILPPKSRRSQYVIWRKSQQIFKSTMLALRDSQLPISEHFDTLGAVRRYSLPYHSVLFSNEHSQSPISSLSSLKKLTMSLSSTCLSSPMIEPNVIINTLSDESLHGTRVLRGLLAMLASLPQLEDLEIHWYNVCARDAAGPEHHMKSLDVTSPPYSAHLKTCTLRGLYVTGEALLEFLKAVQPKLLTMTDISLVSGVWTPIFEYLSSPNSPIASYHLDDLEENGLKLVHFEDVPGRSKFRYLSDILGPSTLIRQACEARATIRYRLPTRRALGSGEYRRWWQSKVLEFGPP
ncbi:hypothetical protein F5Y09DRAFT_341511 [Xylaria sp. FL1042]|nr:hypothetical protein F5Y09DRAFT_341511 [Xylaria sp. FL1042]